MQQQPIRAAPQPSSALKRFQPASVFSRLGVSKAFAGPALLEKVKRLCESQLETSVDAKDITVKEENGTGFDQHRENNILFRCTRVVTQSPHFSRSVLLLKSLHWLHVRHCIIFKNCNYLSSSFIQATSILTFTAHSCKAA